jgi:DNA-binding transcriptional LysR family regulator
MQNIRDLDLNLLFVFEAVMRRGNVSRAANDLGLTQSTISNALRRLRATLDDPLFIRAQYGVTPTPFAEALTPYVREALSAIDRGLEQIRQFDPASVERTFTVIMTDIAEAVILPRVLDICRTSAPGISIRAVNLSLEETGEALKSGGADIAIGYLPDYGAQFYQRHLFNTEYVCVAAKANARIAGGLTLDDFKAARHAVAEARGTGHYVVEQTLERLGIVRRIGARVPHFLSIPFVVASSDLIATIPRALGATMHAGNAVAIVPHPVELPSVEIKLLWHERFHADAANRWLRDQLVRVFDTVEWG